MNVTFYQMKVPHQIIVPPDNCVVLIENIWIDKFVDLSHELVIKEIGEIPNDILDDSEECDEEDEKINTDDGNDEESESEGRGNFDYNVEDVLDEFIDVDEDEDEEDK